MSTTERTVKLNARLGLVLLSVATCVALGAVVFRVGMGPLAEALRWFDPLVIGDALNLFNLSESPNISQHSIPVCSWEIGTGRHSHLYRRGHIFAGPMTGPPEHPKALMNWRERPMVSPLRNEAGRTKAQTGRVQQKMQLQT
jgi:hypothetical protein